MLIDETIRSFISQVIHIYLAGNLTMICGLQPEAIALRSSQPLLPIPPINMTINPNPVPVNTSYSITLTRQGNIAGPQIFSAKLVSANASEDSSNDGKLPYFFHFTIMNQPPICTMTAVDDFDQGWMYAPSVDVNCFSKARLGWFYEAG
jgi:hypothetical protein